MGPCSVCEIVADDVETLLKSKLPNVFPDEEKESIHGPKPD
jgi:hypothetical protein